MNGFGAARLIAIAASLAALAACASGPRRDGPLAETTSGMKEAVVGPFRDLNIVKDKIPPVLLAAERDPYSLRGTGSCRRLAREVAALDLALGPDVDLPQPAARPWTAVLAAAPEAAVDAAIRIGTSLPIRGFARQVSGAARAEEHRKAAVEAGQMRRAFLKGVGVRLGCNWPAVPVALYRAPRLHLARHTYLRHGRMLTSRSARHWNRRQQLAMAGQGGQP